MTMKPRISKSQTQTEGGAPISARSPTHIHTRAACLMAADRAQPVPLTSVRRLCFVAVLHCEPVQSRHLAAVLGVEPEVAGEGYDEYEPDACDKFRFATWVSHPYLKFVDVPRPGGTGPLEESLHRGTWWIPIRARPDDGR